MLPVHANICAGCGLNGRPKVPPPSPAPGVPGGVFFLGGFPDALSAGVRVPYKGRRTQLLRILMGRILSKIPASEQPNCYFGYSCYCSPEYNKETNRYNISVAEYARCAVYARDFIERQRIDVIVAMGTDALRTLGIKGTAKDRRGRVESYDAGGRRVPVVCTFDVGTVVKDTGLVNVFKTDILKAFSALKACGQAKENAAHTPVSFDEVTAKLTNLLEGLNKCTATYVPLAFDTETTSVYPHVLEDRIIAMSFSWADHKGLAVPYQHKEAGFTDAQLAVIKDLTQRILNHPKVRIITANGSFDMRYMRARGFDMPDHAWDIMLAEHILDEDKRGEYSLKDITRDRYPEYANYEEELQIKLRETWQSKDEARKAAEVEIKEAAKQRLTDWWLSLEQPARLAYMDTWVTRGYVTFADTEGMSVVKRVKRKGELVIPKKYLAALSKTLGKIPLTELPAELREAGGEVPAELTVKSFEDIPLATLLWYAAMDVIMTRLIYNAQRADMTRENRTMLELSRKYPSLMKVPPIQKAYLDITIPLSGELARMQLHGIRFDRDKAREYQAVVEDQIAVVDEKMRKIVGVSFNPNSAADLTRILYGDFNLPKLRYTDSGAPAVDADTIKELADDHPDIEFLSLLLDYRKMTKIAGSYFANWLKLSAYDGKLHTEFQQTGTATYRLSSTAPALQTVPFSLKLHDGSTLNLKSLFLPDDGFDIYDLDISNAEMRTLCAYSEDANLIDAFNNNKDIHSLTAAGISGGRFTYERLVEKKEDKTSQEYTQRQIAKKVNFGTIYLMGAPTLKQRLWADNRVDITEEQAQAYLDQFFATYPGVAKYIRDTKEMANKLHFVYTFFGRKRRFPFSYYVTADRERMHRQAVNSRIQGTSSDLVMSCLIRLGQWLRARRDGSCALLTVHDSILFQLPSGCGSGVKAVLDDLIVVKTRETCPWLPVEWAYDCGWGPNYGDTHGEVT